MHQACLHLLFFHTKNPRKPQTCSLQGSEYLNRRVTQCWENSENTQGPGSCVTCLLPKRTSWATARECGCMFLPKTVNRYHCKQPTFVIFIKLYLGIFPNVHTHIQDPVARDSHRIPCADRCVHTPPWPVDEECAVQLSHNSGGFFALNCLIILGSQFPLKYNEGDWTNQNPF